MRDSLTLLRAIADAPGQWDFYAAMRAVECAYPQLPRIGASRRPADDAIRLGQMPSLAFEPGMIAALALDAAGPPRMALNFLGLLGANGPMPTHFTEYVRDRARNAGDQTLVRFLDLFHHRMLSLFYRAWAAAQPAVGFDRPQADRFGDYVGSVAGLGRPAVHGRDAVPDLAKRHYAGRLAAQARNAEGLQAILGDFLHAEVRIEEFVGHWLPLQDEDRTRLRGKSHAQTLGVTTILGAKVWNRQHKFRIQAGPLRLQTYLDLLPGGAKLASLTDWVRLYAGESLVWDLNPVLDTAEIPRLRLGRQARLGRSTWLMAGKPARHADQLVFHPMRHCRSAAQ